MKHGKSRARVLAILLLSGIAWSLAACAVYPAGPYYGGGYYAAPPPAYYGPNVYVPGVWWGWGGHGYYHWH